MDVRIPFRFAAPLSALALVLLASPAHAQFKRDDSAPPAPKPAQQPTQQKPTEEPIDETQVIRIDVGLVNLYFTVRDKRGGYASNLTQDDIEVYEDGKLQTLKSFARETDQPLTLGLLVDVSGSQERLLEDERAASSRFFHQVLRKKDMAFLMSFGTEAELLQDLTNSTRVLDTALTKELRMNAGVSGGITPSTVPVSTPRGTVLYDAVWLAANEKLRTEVGRKAVILISDGVDQGSRVKLAEAVEAAQKADTLVYVILYEDPRFTNPMFGGTGSGESDMRRMCEETGGRVLRVSRSHSLDSIYAQLQEELRAQYVISYPATHERDGRFHKIEIRLKNHKDLKVQARKGYYAMAGGDQ